MFVYEKENLDLIPLDLVGIQMQSKTAAVCSVNGGVLRLVRVVHYTILAVLDVGVNFYIIIGAEPVSYTHLDVYKRQVQGLFSCTA